VHYIRRFGFGARLRRLRFSNCFSTVSSVHTSDLSAFSMESETEIRGSAAVSAKLGCDVASV